MPGVKAVVVIQQPGTEIFWAGDEVVGVAAVDEATAEDALRAIKVQYEVLPHFVSDAEPPKNISADTGPLSSDDFEDMEDNQVPDDQVIARIKKNGISFQAGREVPEAIDEGYGRRCHRDRGPAHRQICSGSGGREIALQENCECRPRVIPTRPSPPRLR